MPPISDELKPAFAHGALQLKGQFTLGSNYTFLVEVMHNGAVFPAVYKPVRGEQPLWDFPENTLAGREVATYLVSEALGWELVPYTILREDGPLGPGSLQEYIEYNPNYHYFSFKSADKERLRRVAVFDQLINNADRKGSHVFFENGTHHLYVIDHGLCFHEEDKLRTVIWDFAGDQLSADLISALEQLRAALIPPASLYTALLAFLTHAEVAALDQRAAALIATGKFPQLVQHRRAYPYPPL
jgi:uncharacterized repeat protein (TIGR03843 family)